MPDPRTGLDDVRQSLGVVLRTLQAPNSPPICSQAAGLVASALRCVHLMGQPGQDALRLAGQAMTDIQQTHQSLEPGFGHHPAWPSMDQALHASFNTLSQIAAASQAQGRPGVAPAAQERAPMPNKNDWAVALLVMRHLYDGDVIDWPLADDHPKVAVFQQLESLGYIARWDRIWPLHDRYRLTEKGIREIEKHYRPADADRIYQQMRQSGARNPKARQELLRRQGVDPWHWTVLHDPYTHWSTWDTDSGSYYRQVWYDPPGHHRTTQHHDASIPTDDTAGQGPAPDDMPPEQRDVVVPLDEPVGVAQSSYDDAPGRDLS
jgi:hypothetical protein